MFSSKLCYKICYTLETIANKTKIFLCFYSPQVFHEMSQSPMVLVVIGQCLLNRTRKSSFFDENRTNCMLFQICLDILNSQTYEYLIQHPFLSIC